MTRLNKLQSAVVSVTEFFSIRGGGGKLLTLLAASGLSFAVPAADLVAAWDSFANNDSGIYVCGDYTLTRGEGNTVSDGGQIVMGGQSCVNVTWNDRALLIDSPNNYAFTVQLEVSNLPETCGFCKFPIVSGDDGYGSIERTETSTIGAIYGGSNNSYGSFTDFTAPTEQETTIITVAVDNRNTTKTDVYWSGKRDGSIIAGAGLMSSTSSIAIKTFDIGFQKGSTAYSSGMKIHAVKIWATKISNNDDVVASYDLNLNSWSPTQIPVYAWYGDFAVEKQGKQLNVDGITVDDAGWATVSSTKGIAIDSEIADIALNTGATIVSHLKDVPDSAGVMISAKDENATVYVKKNATSEGAASYFASFGTSNTHYGEVTDAFDTQGEQSLVYLYKCTGNAITGGVGAWLGYNTIVDYPCSLQWSANRKFSTLSIGSKYDGATHSDILEGLKVGSLFLFNAVLPNLDRVFWASQPVAEFQNNRHVKVPSVAAVTSSVRPLSVVITQNTTLSFSSGATISPVAGFFVNKDTTFDCANVTAGQILVSGPISGVERISASNLSDGLALYKTDNLVQVVYDYIDWTANLDAESDTVKWSSLEGFTDKSHSQYANSSGSTIIVTNGTHTAKTITIDSEIRARKFTVVSIDAASAVNLVCSGDGNVSGILEYDFSEAEVTFDFSTGNANVTAGRDTHFTHLGTGNIVVPIGAKATFTSEASTWSKAAFSGEGTVSVEGAARDTEISGWEGSQITGTNQVLRGTWTLSDTGYRNTQAEMVFSSVDSVLKLNCQDATGYGTYTKGLVLENGAELQVLKRDTFSRRLTLRNGAKVLMSADDLNSGRALDFYNNSAIFVEGETPCVIGGLNSTEDNLTSGSGIVAIRRSNATITVAPEATLKVYSKISSLIGDGSGGSFIKAGAGVVEFYRDASSSLPLQIDGGTVMYVDGGSATTAGITVGENANFELRVNSDSPLSFNKQVSGAGDLVKTGNGQLTLSSNLANHTGEIKLVEGTLDLRGATFGATAPTFSFEDESSGAIVLTSAQVDGLAVEIPANVTVKVQLTQTEVTVGGFAATGLNTTNGGKVQFLDAEGAELGDASSSNAYSIPLNTWTPGATDADNTWSNPSRWSGGVPSATDSVRVQIDSDTTLTMDVAASVADIIVVKTSSADSAKLTIAGENALTVVNEFVVRTDIAATDTSLKMGDDADESSVGRLIVDEGSTIELSTATEWYLPIISGMGTVVKKCAGALVLDLSNGEFVSPMVIDEGRISLRGDGTINGSISGEGSVEIASGTITFGASAKTYTGATTIASGAVLSLGGANYIDSTSSLTGEGTLSLPNNTEPSNAIKRLVANAGTDEAPPWRGILRLNAMTLSSANMGVYGNAKSTVELAGTCTGLFSMRGSCDSAIKITGTVTINNGWSNNGGYTFNGPLSGSGTLILTGDITDMITFASERNEFNGTIFPQGKRAVGFGSVSRANSSDAENKQIIIAENALLTLGSTATLKAEGGVVVHGTLEIDKIARIGDYSNGNRTEVAVKETGMLKFTSTEDVAETNVDLTNITGTGTVCYEGSGYRTLPSNAEKIFPTSLALCNKQERGLVITSTSNNPIQIGTLSGERSFRGDWGEGSRFFRIVQSANSEHTGQLIYSSDTRLTKVQVAGAVGVTENKTLTLSGETTTTACQLEVLAAGEGYSAGSLYLKGKWGSTIEVQNGAELTLDSTAGSSDFGAITIASGATLNINGAIANGRFVSGNFTLDSDAIVKFNGKQVKCKVRSDGLYAPGLLIIVQ